MKYFVEENSIVRQIWGKGDTILFIFAGASAEFALNKAVDWLYYTGQLPADPLGRLFSTVAYARGIVFSEYDQALAVIDKIASIHNAVEQSRSARIPDWAYRDVLFMLIDYSISAFELLERSLTIVEKEAVFQVFQRMGVRMGIPALPRNYSDWLIERRKHLDRDLLKSDYTKDLYKQYCKHLGIPRFFVLKQAQLMVVPDIVKNLLSLQGPAYLRPMLQLYKLSRHLKIDQNLRNLILPKAYLSQIEDLDVQSSINYPKAGALLK